MRNVRVAMCAALTCAVIAFTTATIAGSESQEEAAEAAGKRAAIDHMASDSLEQLFVESPEAAELIKKAYGYAVFDTTKVAVGLTGGGGSGVAVNKQSGERTYMRMGTAGVGVGLGAQNYQVIFMFENADTFKNFVNSKWQGETSADAAAGTEGASASSTFTRGVAVFKMTDKGLLASADIAGTRYWTADKLNQ